MNLHQLSLIDKTFSIMLLFCFVFWFLSKTELMNFIFVAGLYEMGVFPMIALAVLCTFYFLVRWIMNKFTFKKIYFYGFLLSILTVLIMRFVYIITASGITWMPKHYTTF